MARVWIRLLGCAFLFACGRSTHDQDVLRNAGAEPASAAALTPETHDPEQALAQQAKRYAQALLADGPIVKGSLAQGARSEQLLVLRGGYCYRVLGAGGEGVEDLDLLLYDPNGVEVQQDPAQDAFPILGQQSEICPSTSGAYRLQVLMYKGSGDFALRAYRTP